jgi:hypothetical protein
MHSNGIKQRLSWVKYWIFMSPKNIKTGDGTVKITM